MDTQIQSQPSMSNSPCIEALSYSDCVIAALLEQGDDPEHLSMSVSHIELPHSILMIATREIVKTRTDFREMSGKLFPFPVARGHSEV